MADRYVVEFDPAPANLKHFDYNVVDVDVFETKIAWCAIKSDAKRIADALNAVERLQRAVWGPEGVPAWLEGSDK